MPKAFQLVGEEEQPATTATQPPQNEDAQRALRILALALRVVGQRFVIALSHLFTAGALLSAFLLWWRVLPSPSIDQLIGLALYALTVLAVEWVRRK